MVEEFRQSTNKVVMEADDVDTVCCDYCKENPCVWVTNCEDMRLCDESEHGLLTGDDIPNASLRRKGIYRQMALTIAGGPTGRGNRMKLPMCVVNGVRNMFPAEDSKYMGHMDN